MSDAGVFSMVEMIFSFGVILGLAVWQLVSVKRELRRDREAEKKKADAAADGET